MPAPKSDGYMVRPSNDTQRQIRGLQLAIGRASSRASGIGCLPDVVRQLDKVQEILRQAWRDAGQIERACTSWTSRRTA